MRRANGVLASLRLVESFLLTRPSPSRSLHSQVTHYSHLPPFTFSSSLQNQAHNFSFPHNTHQRFYSSSKPNSIVELITTNDWSDFLEQDLERSDPKLINHGTVVYVLKNLEKTPLKALHFFNWISDKNEYNPSLPIYNLMLRILANKETMKDFWGFTKKMSEQGFDVDEETYSKILVHLKSSRMKSDASKWTHFFTEKSGADTSVKHVVDVVLGSNWNEDVENKLVDLKVMFSENVVLNIFRGLYEHPMKVLSFFGWLREHKDYTHNAVTLSENAVLGIISALSKYPWKALSFFGWVREHNGYTHNVVTYNAILCVLAKEESIKEFWSMVKEMKNGGYYLDFDTYMKISRHLGKRGMVKDFVELYELMMDGQYKPPIHDCAFLLKDISLTDIPDMNLAYRVVNKYEAVGYALSKSVYDGIYSCLSSAGQFDEAEQILGTMRNAGFEPDKLTYSHGLFGLGKAGKLKEGIKLLDEMEAKEYVPDIKTWTSLIRGLCTGGEINQALKCYKMMLGKKFKVDADLLEVLVNGLCSSGRVERAHALVLELDKANLRPSRSTYIILIQNLLTKRKLKEGMKLLHLMKKYKFEVFRDPYVDYISRFGTVEDAAELFKAFSGSSSLPFVHVLNSFIKEGRKSEATDLLKYCPDHICKHADIFKLFASVNLANTVKKRVKKTAHCQFVNTSE